MARTKQAGSKYSSKTNHGEEAVGPDYENEYDTLADDVIGKIEIISSLSYHIIFPTYTNSGEDDSGSDGEYDVDKKKKGKKRLDDEEKEDPYMFFDFRRGQKYLSQRPFFYELFVQTEVVLTKIFLM
jgi:hypothetical protein